MRAEPTVLVLLALLPAGCASGPPGGASNALPGRAAETAADGDTPTPPHIRRIRLAEQRDLFRRDLALLREQVRGVQEEIQVLKADFERLGERPPEAPGPNAARADPTGPGGRLPPGEPADPPPADEVEARLRKDVRQVRAERDAELIRLDALRRYRVHLRNELKLREAGGRAERSPGADSPNDV
jgi:hypothetical protein